MADLSIGLVRKIAAHLTLIESGRSTYDPLELLQVADALRRCDEPRLAERCERLARAALPNLGSSPS